MWDNPNVTRIVDDKQRIVLPGVKPGSAVDVQQSPDGKFVVTPLVPKPVPVVRARKVNGRWIVAAGVKPERDAVAAAIRVERDDR